MGMDVKYLKECLGKCLAEGLAEVADRQPVDPINFLASWIYSYKKTINEEEKRKTEKAQLEGEHEEALAELERTEKLEAEQLLIAQKSEEQQKIFAKRQPENTIAELTEKHGAPDLLTVKEQDENSLNEKRTTEKDVNIPEEFETIESKQEALRDKLDQGDLNVVKNTMDEIPGEVSTSVTLQEPLPEIIVDEDFSQIPKEMLDNGEENQSEDDEVTENEHDIQTEDDTPDEEYKLSQDLNLE
ncbi:DPY30 domain-containing protein 1-like [Elgaria multicarinata webbii]|uniref:DPY30 domain-containing protein 1-like n=1 Tax=Elgaria multicarinata webbii TaxID=159646 RepID=UPI002FCD0A54